MAQMLAVAFDESGVIHFEGDKLIVGDFDIIRAVQAAWGGNRQRGRVMIHVYLTSAEVTNLSPDFNGVFTEGSEPPAAGGLG